MCVKFCVTTTKNPQNSSNKRLQLGNEIEYIDVKQDDWRSGLSRQIAIKEAIAYSEVYTRA